MVQTGGDAERRALVAYNPGGGAGTGWCWGGERGLELGWVMMMFSSCWSVGFGDPESLGRASAHQATATGPFVSGNYRQQSTKATLPSHLRCCGLSGWAAEVLLAFLEGIFLPASEQGGEDAAVRVLLTMLRVISRGRPASLRLRG